MSAPTRPRRRPDPTARTWSENPVLVMEELGHIATRQQLLDRGVTPKRIASALLSGELTRVRRAWFASSSADPAAVDAVRIGGRLGYLSASASLGLWSGFDLRTHVVLRRDATRLRMPEPAEAHRFALHWRDPGRADVTSPITWRQSLAECLIHVAEQADEETAIACLDTAITRFGLDLIELERLTSGANARGRCIVSRARAGSDAGGESVARQRFAALGIHLRQQVRFDGIRSVDFVIGTRVIVEIDGRAFHETKAALSRDRRNDARLTALGFVVLRFTYHQLFNEWEFVRDTVLAALAAHG